MRPLLRGCPTCGPGAPDAIHGALHGLVPGHGQLEDDGRGARGAGAGAAQAPARARAPGRLFDRRRCPCRAMHCSASTAHIVTLWEGLQPCTASSRVMGSSKALRRRRLVLALSGASSEGAAAPAWRRAAQHQRVTL